MHRTGRHHIPGHKYNLDGPGVFPLGKGGIRHAIAGRDRQQAEQSLHQRQAVFQRLRGMRDGNLPPLDQGRQHFFHHAEIIIHQENKPGDGRSLLVFSGGDERGPLQGGQRIAVSGLRQRLGGGQQRHQQRWPACDLACDLRAQQYIVHQRLPLRIMVSMGQHKIHHLTTIQTQPPGRESLRRGRLKRCQPPALVPVGPVQVRRCAQHGPHAGCPNCRPGDRSMKEMSKLHTLNPQRRLHPDLVRNGVALQAHPHL